jgi:hypothetical protein
MTMRSWRHNRRVRRFAQRLSGNDPVGSLMSLGTAGQDRDEWKDISVEIQLQGAAFKDSIELVQDRIRADIALRRLISDEIDRQLAELIAPRVAELLDEQAAA